MNSIKSILQLTVFLALSVLATSTSHAILLKTEVTPTVFENSKIINSVVLVNDDKTETTLMAFNHGLRKKTVFGLIPVNIYVLQLLAAHPEKIIKNDAGIINSLKEAGPVQIHLTFLRDLPSEKITNSLKESLEANGLKEKDLANSKEITSLLNEITQIKEIKNGQSFAFTFTWSGDNASVYLTDTNARIVNITGPKIFADQLLSIWFGKAADPRLEDLKKALLK